MPIDNNRIESQIRPIALGRKNRPFAGNLRATAVMSLIQSASLKGHEPFAFRRVCPRTCTLSPAAGSGIFCRIAGRHLHSGLAACCFQMDLPGACLVKVEMHKQAKRRCKGTFQLLPCGSASI